MPTCAHCTVHFTKTTDNCVIFLTLHLLHLPLQRHPEGQNSAIIVIPGHPRLFSLPWSSSLSVPHAAFRRLPRWIELFLNKKNKIKKHINNVIFIVLRLWMVTYRGRYDIKDIIDWIHEFCARNYRPCFHENQPKRSFSIKWKRAFWACFRENRVYKFGHTGFTGMYFLTVMVLISEKNQHGCFVFYKVCNCEKC